MTARMMFLGLVLGGSTAVACGQAMAPSPQDDAQPMDAAQQKASKTFTQKSRVPVAHPPAKPAVLTPLSQRERAQQLLDRFTFGARPGEVDQVLAMGADKWLVQQMSPETIKDPVLDRRLADLSNVDHADPATDRGFFQTADRLARLPMARCRIPPIRH